MKEKITYTIDNANRLVIRRKGKTLTPQGRFEIDGNNRLWFWLNEPLAWRKEYRLPQSLSLNGRWQLNEEHDLEIISDKYAGGCLTLKINIISVRPDAFIFGVNQIDSQGMSHLRILKLSGIWVSDQYNRINFSVEKKVSSGTLIFQGQWQINKSQQITYVYEKTDLKTKSRIKNTLVFEGFWQINSSQKLTYILGYSDKSRFDFRAQLESPSLYPQKGVIKYRIGIGVRRQRRKNVIYLYGEWKFNRKLGLFFQMDYGKNGVVKLNFGAVIRPGKENEISFKLTDEIGKFVGINVIFTHRFLKNLDAEAFLKIKRLEKESGIEAGIRVPF